MFHGLHQQEKITIAAQHYRYIQDTLQNPTLTPRQLFAQDLEEELTYIQQNLTSHI